MTHHIFGNVSDGKAVWHQIKAELVKNGALFECECGHTAYVKYRGVTYAVTDNGGEFLVERINLDSLPVSVPYFQTPALDAMTIVYRLLQALKGEQIDYALQIGVGHKIFYK